MAKVELSIGVILDIAAEELKNAAYKIAAKRGLEPDLMKYAVQKVEKEFNENSAVQYTNVVKAILEEQQGKAQE